MLQIASGKLFHQGVHHTRNLRGVLYSNLEIYDGVQTVAGRLLPTDVLGAGRDALIFEFDERIEGDATVPRLVMSYGVDSYLQDFSALVSFYLEVVCSPDVDLFRRLTSGKRGLATRSPPNQLLKPVFDAKVAILPKQATEFAAFIAQLIGLERKTFLEVMRAIRTYVTGLHRMGDDLELAYTLMVASVESLGQAFDAHQGTWGDFEEVKRRRVDEALGGVEATSADRVRAAILENEHVALRRRFIAFAQANLSADFYRDRVGRVLPIGRQDLPDGLDTAYRLRSSYVHRLLELPHEISDDQGHVEARTVDHRTALTFQGMARVARTVILEFVSSQATVETEPYDYTHEIPNISRGLWAPQVWMNSPDSVQEANARAWFEGFLEQVSAYFLSPASAQFSDIRGALQDLPKRLPEFNAARRLPYLAAYFAYNLLFPPGMRHAEWEAVHKQYNSHFDKPSPESLVLHCLVAMTPSWGLKVHAEALDKHVSRRSHDNGYRFPQLFDVAMSMDLIERYRAAGDVDEARRRLSLAAETFPSTEQLFRLEAAFEPTTAVEWRKLLLPQAPPGGSPDSAEPAQETATAPIQRKSLLCRLVAALSKGQQ
jgi:hypothetical protein